MYRIFITLCCFFSFSLFSITIDLKNPVFSEGVLTTEEGGVITGPNFRLQAQKIIYTKKEQIEKVEAEGDLILEYCDYLFVGQKLEYDFLTKTGTLYEGRTSIEPWFFGGEEIRLCADGSYVIYKGFATTAEGDCTNWRIKLARARVEEHRYLSAKNVTFQMIELPLFWMSSFHLDLDSIFDSPFRYTARWGGTHGPRIGVVYEVFSSKTIKTLARLDYRSKSGIGGGLEVKYKAPDRYERFHSINYIAKDKTRFDHKRKTRYRYQGDYRTTMQCGRTTLRLSYDKLSDKEMATDYADMGLKLENAKRTELALRHEQKRWILNFLTRFRINSFQTLLQELPTLSLSLKPITLGSTGIISENQAKLSYMELEYTEDTPNVHDFNSPRYELSGRLYRPFKTKCVTLTPEVGTVAIFYGNNENRNERWMTIGLFELTATTDLYRFYAESKHVISPYARYRYYTFPSTSPDDHFIFDIEDGWYRVNTFRLGVVNNLYLKQNRGCIYRKFYADVYMHGFIDTNTISYLIPKAYFDMKYNVTPRLRYSLNTAWDIERNLLNHCNARIDYTLHVNFAIAAEYRHRSPFYWRKVDYDNFVLDSFRDQEVLANSSLSDRRDTVSLHFFYRFQPRWALEFQSRNGWNRMNEPSYFEYQVNLLGTYRSAWQIKLSYRHRTDDDRFTINLSLGQPTPVQNGCCVPCLEF